MGEGEGEGKGIVRWIASGKLSHKEKFAQTDLKKIIITRTVSQKPVCVGLREGRGIQENTLIAASFGNFSICNLFVQRADKQAQQIMEKYAKNCSEAWTFYWIIRPPAAAPTQRQQKQRPQKLNCLELNYVPSLHRAQAFGLYFLYL